MRRSLRYMALGVLTASLLSGNALTALADQDVNHGPGVSQAPEVSPVSYTHLTLPTIA